MTQPLEFVVSSQSLENGEFDEMLMETMHHFGYPARVFPFRTLLPEIQDLVVDFLDPMAMLQALLVDQQFYFGVTSSNLYKSFRVIMLLYKDDLVLPNSNYIVDVNEMPTDENLMKKATDYLLNKYKFFRSSFLKNHFRIKLENMDTCTESQVKNIEKCLAIIIQHFKVYDSNSLFRSNYTKYLDSYRLFPKEFKIWRELTDLLELSVDEQQVNSKIYDLIDKSITFPYGPSEMSRYMASEYPNFKRTKDKLWADRKKDEWITKFYASIKDNSVYYLLARLALLPFGNVPEELKSNKNFMVFFIQHHQELCGAFFSKIVRNRKPDEFERIYLVPSLSCDKDLIREAYQSNDPLIYESVFETSCYGITDNKILDRTDYELFAKLFKNDVPSFYNIVAHNRKGFQKYAYTEKDLIEIIKIEPIIFQALQSFVTFETYPELCKEAVSRLGENFTLVPFTNKDNVYDNGELFKLACQNLKNKEVFLPSLYNSLHPDLKENVEYLKQVTLYYPTLCKNFKTQWLENQMDLILHIAPIFSVLDHLFVYDPRKNFKSTNWLLPYGDSTENRKQCKPDFLTTNLEFAKRTLKSFPYQLQRFSKEIQENDEICNIIVESGCDLTLLPMFYNKVKNNLDWIKKSIDYGTNIFLFDEKVYNNPELFKLAIKNCPKLISMSEKFQKDRDMVLFTIQCCRRLRNESPKYLSFDEIDTALLEDDEIVERAILESPTFVDINHLPQRFQSNIKLARATLLKYPGIYQHFPESLKENLELAELAIRSNANNFNDLSKHLKENRDFFLLAISRGYNYNRSGVTFQPLETDYIKWCYDEKNPNVIKLSVQGKRKNRGNRNRMTLF